MAIAKGYRKSIGVGEESTYGTAATSGWLYIAARNESLAKNNPKIVAPSLRGGVAGHIKRLVGPTDITGSIEADLHPEGGIPLLVKVAMGQVSSTQQGGTSAYKHTFSIVDNIVYGETKGVTCRVDRDIRVINYYGCVVNVMNIASAYGNTPATIRFDMIGKDATTGTSPSPTFSSANPFLHTNATFSVDSSSVNINTWNINLNNNYKTDVYGGNSSRVYVPRGGFREVTGSVTLPVIEDFGIYDKFIAGTAASLTVTFTGATISGAYSYAWVITIPILYYDGPTAPASGGIETPNMECPFTVTAQDSSNLEFTMDVTSTETSI